MSGAGTSRRSLLPAALAAATPPVAAPGGAAADGAPPVATGARAAGLRHGRWRIVHPDGSVEEGCYVAGLLHGEWTLRDPAGRVVARERWCLGRSAGPMDGEDALCGVTLPDACREMPAR